jgi:hypothetical protein
MIEVTYLLEDDSSDWVYSVKKIRTAVECIREDMKEIATIVKAIVFDENGKKILEVER